MRHPPPVLGRRHLLVLGSAAAVGCASTRENKGEDASPLDASSDAADAFDAVDPQDARDSGADTSTCAGTYEGSVDDFPGGTWVLVGVGDARAFVVRDDDGLYAYSAICTHTSCLLVLADTFGRATCPCHGAAFDGNGQVTAGPATVSLKHYLVTICGRKVYVDRSTIVPDHQRTVP